MLSLFAGIGGLEHSLGKLDLLRPGVLIISFDIMEACRSVLSAIDVSPATSIVSLLPDQHGRSGSVLSLVENSCSLLFTLLRHYSSCKTWLVVGGSPCQGFSTANPAGRGFMDHRSQLLWTIPVIVSNLAQGIEFLELSSVVHFISEMVRPKTVLQRRLFDSIFHTTSIEIDNSSFSGISRPRLWWLSFDHPPPPHVVRLDPGSILTDGWRPLWELLDGYSTSRRFGTRLRPCDPGEPAECPLPWRRFPLSMYGVNHLVYLTTASQEDLADLRHRVIEGIKKAPSDDTRPPKCIQDAIDRRVAFARWIHHEGGHRVCRCLTPSEVEAGMGFPPDSSLPPQEFIKDMSAEDVTWLRHSLLGNAFAVNSASYALAGLKHIFDAESLPPQPPRNLTSLPSTYEAVQSVYHGLRPQPVLLPTNEAR